MSPRESATVPHARWAAAWAENLTLAEVLYPPGNGTWTAQAIEVATGKRVDAAYYAALRECRVYAPWDTVLEDIAAAMGFPAELWEKSLRWWRGVSRRVQSASDLDEAVRGQEEEDRRGRTAQLLDQVLEELMNPGTGRPYTNRELALESGGDLAQAEIEAMRDGRLADPTPDKLLALYEVFGVGCWCWREKIPRLSQPLLALLTSGPELIALCGERGTARSALDALRDGLDGEEKVMLSEEPTFG